MADVIITLANVNDNTPTFEPDNLVVVLAENVKSGTIIVTVQAKDADGDSITYNLISGGNDLSNFVVGATTGVVKINPKINPIFSVFKYVLNISASDGLNVGYFTLTIHIEDVNDNSPEFRKCTNYRPMVFENEPIGTLVSLGTNENKMKASDNDQGRNGLIEYSIQEPQKGSNDKILVTESDFRIDNETGQITTNKIFDREEKSRYIVLVIAQDGGHGRSPAERNSGSCQIEILIEDINDHSPVFSVASYDISIAENTPIDSVVLEVSAQDKDEGNNAALTYSIKQGSLTPQFKIDPSTGAISVSESLIGQQTEYRFRVTAADSGSPSKTSDIEVRITVQPSNPPKFSLASYRVSIPENTEVGSDIVTVVATSQQTDKSSKIFYSVLPGNLPSTNSPPTFTVDSDKGIIKLARVLDFETLKEYVLEIQAVEGGMKSNAKVFISITDVNDNSPLFVLREYQFGKISEGKSPGQVVETVNATDADSGLFGEVRYYLIDSVEAKMFSIDEISGQIRSNVVFDREVTPSVTFTVKAQDQGPILKLEDIVYVKILITDVNDNGPIFKQERYAVQIEENAKVGFVVQVIEAEDADTGENAILKYYIVSGNEKGYFNTNSFTRASGVSLGQVLVAKKLDREDQDKFTLKIAASDTKYNAFAFVDITVSSWCFGAVTFQIYILSFSHYLNVVLTLISSFECFMCLSNRSLMLAKNSIEC